LVFRFDGHADDGFGNVGGLSVTSVFVAQRVTRGDVAQTDQRGDVAGIDLVDVLAFAALITIRRLTRSRLRVRGL